MLRLAARKALELGARGALRTGQRELLEVGGRQALRAGSREIKELALREGGQRLCAAGRLLGKLPAGKQFASWAGLQCFTAGTQVVVGVNPDGSYITRNIEDIQAGDTVLSRDQYSDSDDVSPHRVVEVYKHTVDHVRIVTIADADGNIETIRTTDTHPFYVEGMGWVEARDLQEGQRLNEADDTNNAMVISSVREEHPEGITVYNFQVEGEHTYFVEDGQSGQTAIWVHNWCQQGHHPLAMFLGGEAKQWLYKVGYRNHQFFHRRLLQNLRANGVGNFIALNAKADKWEQVFRANPGLQKVALNTVLQTAREVDRLKNTKFTYYALKNLLGGRFSIYG